LINHGKVITLLIEPSLAESESLSKMNKGKVGRKFRFSEGLISAAFAVKCVFRIAYRQVDEMITNMEGTVSYFEEMAKVDKAKLSIYKKRIEKLTERLSKL
jgi:hypothetical protein